MADVIGHHRALAYFHDFETTVIRLALGKSLKQAFPHTVSGKFSLEKGELLLVHWLNNLEKKCDILAGMGAAAGIKMFVADEDTTAVADEVHLL